MKIYPDFYPEFSCQGEKCLNTCCTNRELILDSETYEAYQTMPGEIGDMIRKHLFPKKGTAQIPMNADLRCPFLNEQNLCDIYYNCGTDYLCHTCRKYPQYVLRKGRHSMAGISLSCEEVLRMIYHRQNPIVTKIEENLGLNSENEQYLYQLYRLTDWATEVLQEETLPFPITLSSIIYLGLSTGNKFLNQDYDGMNAEFDTFWEVYQDFTKTMGALSIDQLDKTAWQFIFQVTNMFCEIVRESDLYQKELYLWDDSVFQLGEEERQNYLYHCWRMRTKAPEHLRFVRRLASLFFSRHMMELGEKDTHHILLENMCNYMIVAEVLPATWKPEHRENLSQYFMRLACIGRLFDDSNIMSTMIAPMIENTYHPDVLTYAMAFMALFQ